MDKKFGASLTERQMALARAIQAAGLTTISQAVKAFERRDNTQIEAWKQQLQAIRNSAAAQQD